MLSVSGILASSAMGWPSIFYFSGAAGGIWAIFWLIFGCDSPAEYKNISAEERSFIESATETTTTTDSTAKRAPTPWLAMFTSLPFISLIIVHSAHNWGFWTLLTKIPGRANNHNFVRQLIHTILFLIVFSVHGKRFRLGYQIGERNFNLNRFSNLVKIYFQNSLLSALPYFAMMMMSYFFSYLSSVLVRTNWVPLIYSRKLFNSIGKTFSKLILVESWHVKFLAHYQQKIWISF